MKLLFACWIFSERFSFLGKSYKDQKVRFFAYILIADRINRINVKITASPWRSTLTLDFSRSIFFYKVSFFRKVRISIRDWNIYFSACLYVIYKKHIFGVIIRFGAKLGKSSLDNSFLYNILKSVFPYLTSSPSLFKKS